MVSIVRNKFVLILALCSILSCKSKRKAGSPDEAVGETSQKSEQGYEKLELNLTERSDPKKVNVTTPTLFQAIYKDDEGKVYSAVAFNFEASSGQSADSPDARVDYYEYEIKNVKTGKKVTGQFGGSGELLCAQLAAGNYTGKFRPCQDPAKSKLGCGNYTATNIISIAGSTSSKLQGKMQEICNGRESLRSKAEDLYSGMKSMSQSIGKSYTPKGFDKTQINNCAQVMIALDDLGPTAFSHLFAFYGDQMKTNLVAPIQEGAGMSQEDSQGLNLTTGLDVQLTNDGHGFEIAALAVGGVMLLAGFYGNRYLLSPYNVTILGGDSTNYTRDGFKNFLNGKGVKEADVTKIKSDIRSKGFAEIKGVDNVTTEVVRKNFWRDTFSGKKVSGGIAAIGVGLIVLGSMMASGSGLVPNFSQQNSLTEQEAPPTCFTGSPSEALFVDLGTLANSQNKKVQEFADMLSE